MLQQSERPGFDRRMTSEEINACTMARFEGRVHIVRTRKELDAALDVLGSEKVLGFDTETRPSFKKGESYPPALIQLGCTKAVYIFQLKFLKFPVKLRKILSNPAIVKAGVACDYDIRQLKLLGDFREAGFTDLGEAARRAGIKNHGLRGLCAVLLGFRISKNAKVSNWSRSDLTEAQIKYAATDAWVSRELYLHLVKMRRQGLLPGGSIFEE